MAKERHQDPAVGDTLRLRLVTWNANTLTDVYSVEKVEVYFLDPTFVTIDNPDGRRLLTTVESADVVRSDSGNYYVDVVTSPPAWVIGKYIDVWTVVHNENDPDATWENCFEIFPNLWYSTTMPAVYGFNFRFQPNRIRKGSKKWLIAQILPNVPRATDLERFYTNLAIAADMKIYIEQECGPCPLPPEEDLRLVVDGEQVEVRDKVFGFYLLDTRELDCGIYNVWFELTYADTIELSEKMQLLIH